METSHTESRPMVAATGMARRLAPALWLAVIAAAAIVFIVRDQHEVQQIAHALRRAQPGWTAAAILAGTAAIVLLAATAGPVLRRLGAPAPLWPLVRAHLQRHAVSTLLPLGGPAGIVSYVRALDSSGVPAADAVIAALAASVLGTVSFVAILIPALIVLAANRGLTWILVAACIALVLVVALLCWLLWLVMRAHPLPGVVTRWLPGSMKELADDIGQRGLHWRDLVVPFLLAIGGDVAYGLMLWCCLGAVHHPVTLVEAFTAYGIGTLFLLVSPAFQGLGLVEASLAVTLTAFGVPAPDAIGAALLYRFGELWVPLGVGLSSFASNNRAIRGLPAHVPAVITGLTGVFGLFSVLNPQLPMHVGRLKPVRQIPHYDPFTFVNVSRTVTLVASIGLIFLAFSLWKRRRIAWIAAVILLSMATVTHFGKRHDQVVAIISGLNVLLLLLNWRRYRVRNDIPTMLQGIAGFLLSVLVALAYGTFGFWLLDKREFGIDFGWRNSFTRTIRLFFGLSMSDLVPRTRYADWFLDSFHVVGALSLLLAIYSLARPVVWRRKVHSRELAAARALIEQYGSSPLDFFKFGPDKLIFFSSTRRGLVSFRVANSVALALGDPVARDKDEFCRVLKEFMQFCADNDWRVAFHQVPATALCDYASVGLKSLKIGEEAMVNVQTFTLEGRPMKTLRSGVRKIANLGYDTRIYQPPISPQVMGQLKAISEDWLALPGRRERGFTLGQFDEHYLTACPIMTVESQDGEIWAFANFIPDFAPGETTIDLMRYRRDAPNGMMDFLFVRLFEYTRAEGYRRFALGLAPFAEVGSSSDAPTREKALRLLIERLSFAFSYKGLWAYKEKFRPDWEPRYLIYESELALPATTVAIVRITEG